MKSATIGIALAALNMAKASTLFEEAFDLANYDDVDFDTDLQDITDFDDDFEEDFSESEGRMLQAWQFDEPDEPARMLRRKGRKNRKNNNKGPFNYDEKVQKIADKKAKKDEKLPEKCDKRKERGLKVCEMVENPEDQERCNKWIDVKHVTCTMKGACRNQLDYDRNICGAQFKYMQTSFWIQNDEEIEAPMEMNSAAVGRCFTETLDAFDDCAEEADQAIDAASEGFEAPTEEEIAAFKKAMQEQRKNKRQQNKNNRNNRRNNRRNWRNNEDGN